jgi:nitric oxide reductase subunit C
VGLAARPAAGCPVQTGSDVMTKRQAALFSAGATGLFTAVFVGLTIHSHTAFPRLTNAHLITDDVRAGNSLWHHHNCVNCHTLMGEGAYYAPDLTQITLQRGEAYLVQFLGDPSRFYSEEVHRRLMPNPNLTEPESRQLIAFLDWIARIENQNWPPRPILVAGSAAPGLAARTRDRAASDDPVAMGEALFQAAPPGCAACHSTSPGVVLAGPSMAHMAARAETTVQSPDYTGAATTAEEYVRESILEPSAHIVPGELFSVGGTSVMPNNYDEMLTPEQIEQLVAYLMTLR